MVTDHWMNHLQCRWRRTVLTARIACNVIAVAERQSFTVSWDQSRRMEVCQAGLLRGTWWRSWSVRRWTTGSATSAPRRRRWRRPRRLSTAVARSNESWGGSAWRRRPGVRRRGDRASPTPRRTCSVAAGTRPPLLSHTDNGPFTTRPSCVTVSLERKSR